MVTAAFLPEFALYICVCVCSLWAWYIWKTDSAGSFWPLRFPDLCFVLGLAKDPVRCFQLQFFFANTMLSQLRQITRISWSVINACYCTAKLKHLFSSFKSVREKYRWVFMAFLLDLLIKIESVGCLLKGEPTQLVSYVFCFFFAK